MIARWLVLILGYFLVVGGSSALAQSSADAYFHEAAQHFVKGATAEALETVQEGLEVDPSNSRLRALRERIDQEKNESGEGSASQAGREAGEQEKRAQTANQSGDLTNGQREDPGSDSEENAGGDNRTHQPSDRGESRAQGRNQEGFPLDGRPMSRRNRPENVLSRAQANRMLEALEAQEKKLLRELRVSNVENKTVEKDW